MKVSELIATLEDVDPDLPVYVTAHDTDYDYQTLSSNEIGIDYVTDMDDNEIKALIIGSDL
jgi:hypothetical protein